MFSTAYAFNQTISSWNVSSVTDMNTMFLNAYAFNNGAVGDVGGKPLTWSAGTGTSIVGNMRFMFSGASAFNQDISGWDVSSVTDMGIMFYGASAFNNGVVGDVGGKPLTWTAGTGTSNVLYMNNMFGYATQFNQDVSSWNVSNVTNMSQMFANTTLFNNCFITSDLTEKPITWTGTGISASNTMADMFNTAVAFNQDVSSWNVSNVTNMGSMFEGAVLFNNGDPGNNGANSLYWTDGSGTSRVTSMYRMFLSAAKFNQDVSSWNVSSVTNMSNMFQDAALFNNGFITGDLIEKPLAWTGTGISVSNNMTNMFYGTLKFNQDVSSWNVSNVTDMTGMFSNATAFNQNITGWNVSRVANMQNMFNSAVLFDQNIRIWSVVYPTSLFNMFIDATAMAATYTGTEGYASTPSYTFFTGPLKSLFLTFYVTDTEISPSVTLPISGVDVVVSVDWGDGTTDTSLSHTYNLIRTYTATITITSGSVTQFGSNGWVGVDILTDVSTNSVTDWGLPGVSSFANAFNSAFLLVSVPTYLPSSVRNLSYMFNNADAFNQNISGWNVSLVTNMSYMFAETLLFDQNIGTWNVSSVTDMSSMFNTAAAFNRNISTWNVSNVLDMTSMFQNAPLFDQDIQVWVVVSPTTLTNMFTGATAMTARYTGTTGYGPPTTYAFFTGPPAPYPCFLEDTQILCLENGREVYRPVQSLRKGDLVKTIYNGFLPIHMIGTTPMYNPNNNDRIASRLYRCPKENYPGLFEDLYITGCHSILVPWLTYEQGQKTIKSLGRLFVTDKHCRLMAWVDEKAQPYKMAGVYNIYHIALENKDYYMNYGIYANGLLVESCSKRYLMEMSNMRILGEDDCSLTDGSLAEENVFHKIPALIESC